MAIEHVDIDDPEIHEPKGASTASAGEVYVADGAASGAWDFQNFVLEIVIRNINSASSSWVVSPYAATIEKIFTVIDGAITTADETITAEIDGTLVTDSTVTIATAGSAAGTVDSSTPSAANAVTAGQAIEIINNGACDGSVDCTITFLMKRTA